MKHTTAQRGTALSSQAKDACSSVSPLQHGVSLVTHEL